MIEAGVCDQRGAAFCATAVKLPSGAFGMVLLGVKGSVLSIYDTDMRNNVGDHLYSIDLKKISDLKINDNFFAEMFKGYGLRFVYDGFTYTFKNCCTQKAQLAVIRSEAK